MIAITTNSSTSVNATRRLCRLRIRFSIAKEQNNSKAIKERGLPDYGTTSDRTRQRDSPPRAPRMSIEKPLPSANSANKSKP
jgi:hypothetical protein